MLESVLSIAGATMALFGLFVLVDLAFAGRLAPERERLVQLAAFLALALVSLGYNTQVRPGVIVDARGAVIAAAALFGGAPVGALVAGTAALYRLLLGGDGAWAGVAGITVDLLLSLVVARLFARSGITWRNSLWPFVGAGAAVAAGEASSLLAVPPRSEALELFRRVAPTLALVQVVTTVLIGGLGKLLWDRRREGLERTALAQRYALLARHASDAIVLADASGRILEANRRACRLYGYDDAEIRRLRLDELRASPAQLRGQKGYAGATTSLTGGSRQIHVHRDGRQIEVEVKERLLDEAGRPLQLLIARDITTAERTLLRYHRALETTADGFAIFSGEGRVLEANQALCALTGHPHRELVGMSLADLVLEPAAEDARALMGDSGVFESRWRRRDGSTVDVELSASADSGSSEPLIAFVRDVGERKRAERALAESESRYRLLAENSTDVIWTLDVPSLRFSYVSPSVERLRGFTAEEVQAQPMEKAMTADSARRIAGILPLKIAAFEAGDASSRTSVNEISQPRKDGSIVETEVVATLLTDASGKVTGILGVTRDVTDRKRREEELRVKEAALASSSAGIAIVGLDGVVTYANRACLDMWGFASMDEVLGTSGFAYWRNPEAARRSVEVALSEGRWTGDLEARRMDGSTFDANTLTNRVEDADGRPLCVLASFVDVTETKRSAEALRREKERLETASRSGRVAMWDWDLGSQTLEWSGFIDPLLALPADEPMSSEEFLGHVHPDDHAPLRQALARHFEEGTPFALEFRLRRVDGSYAWVRDVGAALRDEAGRPRRMSGAITDVTEVKAAEAALRANQARLEEAQSLAHLGSWEFDLATGRLTWSSEADGIFEVEPSSFGGSFEAFLSLVHPEDREGARRSYAESLESGAPHETEHRLVMPDGRVKWVRERWRTELGPDGTPLRQAGTVQDLSEQMLVREARSLAEAKEAAEAANRAKSAFLASMSHEIRTPMNAILGFSQLLMGDAGLTARQKEQLGAIHRSGEHLLGLIDDVLEMSKIEAGRVTLTEGEVDLFALTSDLESMFRMRARQKELSLELERAADLPRHVVTDEKKLRQILINLLGNGVKFTARGGLKVRVRTEPDGGEAIRLLVDVEDTGPGISADELDRLFQRFEQTRTGREASGGTGLGLAISRGFARLMRGDITVTSRVGEGSVFTLSLPVARATASGAVEKTESRRVLALEAGEARRRILVADDVAENREILRQMLERVGFEVRTANDGAEALALVERWHPNLVLMDLRMPGMDGLEATRTIRASDEPHRIPIVAVTASAFEEDRRQVEEAGGDDFVAKPFRESELLQKVGRWLGVRYVFEGGAAQPGGELPLEAPRASCVPSPLREAFRTAVVHADLDRVRALTDELEASHPECARAVRELAERFEYDRLIAYFEEEG